MLLFCLNWWNSLVGWNPGPPFWKPTNHFFGPTNQTLHCWSQKQRLQVLVRIFFPTGSSSSGETWLAHFDRDWKKPHPLIQNLSCELCSLLMKQTFRQAAAVAGEGELEGGAPVAASTSPSPYLSLHHCALPPVQPPKCAVRVFLVPPEINGNKKRHDEGIFSLLRSLQDSFSQLPHG